MSQCCAPGAPSVARRSDGVLRVVEVRRPGLVEFHITASPHASRILPPAAQANEVYKRIRSLLEETGAQGVQERVFGQLACQTEVLKERVRQLTGAEWPVSYIEGGLDRRIGIAGVHLYAVAGPACAPVCLDDHRIGTQFLCGETQHVYLSLPVGLGVSGPDEDCARAMFHQARDALAQVGCCYTDVVRTWIYIADILGWYGRFNAVRTPFYEELALMGVPGKCRVPASTGIEGTPGTGAACCMDLLALHGRRGVLVAPLHNPMQNEAYAYGSAFARGMSVAYGGVETAYISGTASIDEEGRTVHAGDLEGQVRRTIENIRALIATRGFTLDDVALSNTFVKHGQDTGPVMEILAAEGGPFAEGILVAADVCRDDLLFEIDGLAVRVTK